MDSKPIAVLLIEDNPGDVFLVRQILTDENFPVRLHVVPDGEQALQLLADERFRPDLIILDLHAPRVSGLSFLERSEVKVPIVIFSSSFSPDDFRRSFELGARAVVQKPSDFAGFTRMISQIVRDWAPSRNNAVSTAD